MADDTPETTPPRKPAARKPAAAKKPAARKPAASASAAKKPTAKATSAAGTTPASASPPPAPPEPVTVPPSVPPASPAASPITDEVPTAAYTDRSVLGRVRANRTGALLASLVVALAVGLLLSVLVPSEPNVLALIILGTLEAAAVGFTVRYLSVCRGLRAQVTALVVAGLGVHLMTVTGSVDSSLPSLPGLGSGIGFNEALLAALATPPISAGTLLAGLVAAIIAGWGQRSTHSSHP